LCFVFVFVPGQAALSNLSPSSVGYQVNDAHLHYVDFVQETDGIEALLGAMNETGVEQTMIADMPVIKKWDAVEPMRPLYYLADDAPTYWYQATDITVARALEDLPAEQRRRFHPFICGFNPTDLNAVDHVKGCWSGIPDYGKGSARYLPDMII
jgi:hypothetical protein